MDFLANLCAENLSMSLIFIIFAAMKLKLKEGFRGERKIVLPPQVVEMEEQDPLMQGLHITDIGFYPRASHHYCQRREPISAHVLIYCVDGRGWYRIGDEAELHVGRDQYFILPAGRPHVYGSDDAEPWTIYWLHFKGSQADVYADGAAAPSDVRPSLQSRISDRGQLFEEIFSTMEYGFGRENLRYASTMLHHYLGTMRYLQQFRLADIRRPNSENDVVAAAIHYMRENLEHRLTLSDLSRFTAEPVELFKASDAPNGGVVTDGPFLWRTAGGKLLCLWAGFSQNGYTQGVALSGSGEITGPFCQIAPLFDRDGGHGMLFRTKDGTLMLTLHSPNEHLKERPRFIPMTQDWL